MSQDTPYTDQTHPLFPECHYHIYNHANGKHNIFFTEENRRYFLQKYDTYMGDYVHTFAYCLMPNHFHFQIQVRTKQELLAAAKIDFPKGLSKATRHAVSSFQDKTDLSDDEAVSIVSERLRRFFLSYAKSINSQEKIDGSLLRKNFRRKPIHTLQYFLGCIAYIHRNPTHHGFTDDWKNWKWSSHGRILLSKTNNIANNIIINAYGSTTNFVAYHDEYDKYKKEESQWAIEEDDD
jgi:putative transposase